MYHNKSLKRRIKNEGTLFISGFVVQTILMILAVTVATAFPAIAADAASAESADDVEQSPMTTEAIEDINAKDVNVSSGEDIAAGGMIQSITFDKDRTIKDGLRVLSAMYKKNIVPSAKVDGVMGFTRLYNVTFEEAMDAILGANFKYEQKGQLIMVYTADEYKKIKEDKSRMVDKVFTLYYINAAEVKALITPLLSESGKVTSTAAAAVDTEAGKGGDTTSMRDTVVVYDFPERLDQIGRMIKEVDVKPQQILIEVTVLNATLTETTEFGINWTKIAGMTATPSQGFPFGMAIGLASGISPAGTGLTATLSNEEVVASITALEDVSNVTVLANPKIMALNKQAGYINIGGETGYTESTTQTSTGTTASVKMLPYGTILRFRPFICDDGYIRMEISPELSTATTKDSNGGAVIPSKTLTEVKTNIMVQDGKTIIIGGLFKEQITSTDAQVPLIGDLPIFGVLAKRTKDANVRTELIILITPHIISTPENLASESKDRMSDISRIYYGSRKGISSFSRVRIYEDCYAEAVECYLKGDKKAALNKLNWVTYARPEYLEASRLKERIIRETAPDGAATIERIMLDVIEREESKKWLRK
jgi:type II secretory pathway component GspD/PulD (secretin)